ncbi:hypothetical protein TSAR_014065 [Trichomalopsis sarcophagae]|uniref:Uncharacterized protein n=1 Tax=Trichomalopsis sarcophagae TaxID=543379 RepID=A0A232FMK3_9HYME|nr:hypothetical protein TSAR_014065 [Trichomalopsis sarcophagae]
MRIVSKTYLKSMLSKRFSQSVAP